VRGGLTRRTILASAALALLVGAAFAILVTAIRDDRNSADRATRSVEVIAAASFLERVVLDLETGQRGYLVGRRERFLTPWTKALRDYRPASRALLAAAAQVDRSEVAARRLADAVDAYIADYSVPVVNAARRGDPEAASVATLEEGKRRVDALRRQFDTFIDERRRAFTAREEAADDAAQRAIVVATIGLGGSIVLVIAFGAYLTRAIALPVRRAADAAGRLATGDLSTRLAENGTGEVATLERSFNAMAGSLEASRDELRQLVEEQAALRRVATLVARAVPSDEVFDAVAAEARGLLRAHAAGLLRFEEGDAVTLLASLGAYADGARSGDRITVKDESISSTIKRTGRSARFDRLPEMPGLTADTMLRGGMLSAVGAPITVGGRLWGALIAGWTHERPEANVEDRMSQFTDLVATALANAESRAELAASRARVVTTADETRRQIERDLHDGAQQRLVHAVITLKLALRSLGDAPGTELVQEGLENAERANTELRDLAHGILPPALSRGGLLAGVETIVSRLRVPVTVDVTPERFPPALEATAYFIIAEALTNAAKHARANSANVTAAVDGDALRVEVRDDGVGGARVTGSSGLLGLQDRAAALGGDLCVESPPGEGTTITATLPIPEHAASS
jgi:signal transduction histidine kinase